MKWGVFVFDTELDSDFSTSTTRAAAAFWREFCYAAGWEFAYERVHSVADIVYFLEHRRIEQPILIFNGHGNDTDGWQLSNGEAFGINHRASGARCVRSDRHRHSARACTPFRMRKENSNKYIVFSSCEIGHNPRLCTGMKSLLRAQTVFAYERAVYDDVCLLAEANLAMRLSLRQSASEAAKAVCSAMSMWPTLTKAKGDKDLGKEFPLVYY